MTTNQDNIINRTDIVRAINELATALIDDPTGFDDMEDLNNLRSLLVDVDQTLSCSEGWYLIRDSYFQEWCEGYAGDMGATSGWPYNCIDWAKAADALKQDYKQIYFDRETYWVRA